MQYETHEQKVMMGGRGKRVLEVDAGVQLGMLVCVCVGEEGGGRRKKKSLVSVSARVGRLSLVVIGLGPGCLLVWGRCSVARAPSMFRCPGLFAFM